MPSTPALKSLPERNEGVYDLATGRLHLREVAMMAARAADAFDPREVLLALAVLAYRRGQ